MVAAVPADHQIERVVLDADDDLVDQRSHDPLARLGCHAGTRPGPLQIGAERHQPLAIGRCEIDSGRSRQSLQLGLQIAHDRQPLVPSLLQLGGDEAVVGIDGIVLATRAADLVAGLLQRQLDLAALVFVRTAARSLRGERRLDAERLQALDHLGSRRRGRSACRRTRCSDRRHD